MTSKLEKAEAYIAELETRKKALETDLNYYRNVARNLSTALDKMGVRVWVTQGDQNIFNSEIERIQENMRKAKHMDILQSAIKADENVAEAWKKFMVTLRLCGFDSNDRDPNAG